MLLAVMNLALGLYVRASLQYFSLSVLQTPHVLRVPHSNVELLLTCLSARSR
jgi:hypothetical protein